MNARRIAFAALAPGLMLVAACGPATSTHETPEWSSLIGQARDDLAAIQASRDASGIDSSDPQNWLVTTNPEAVETDWDDLRVGQCLLWPYTDYPASTLFAAAQVVPCDEPHYGEVYYVSLLMDAEYQDKVIASEVDHACEEQFAAYVGVEYWDSIYNFDYSLPSQSGWDAGVRSFRCYVIESDYETVGSLKGVSK